jgi:hypothetical protein
MAAAWRGRGSSAWTHKTAAAGLAPVRMLKALQYRHGRGGSLNAASRGQLRAAISLTVIAILYCFSLQ